MIPTLVLPDEDVVPPFESTSQLPLIEEDVFDDDAVERSQDHWAGALPARQGLYDPDLEKDACGVGFVCHIKGFVSLHLPRFVLGSDVGRLQ